MVSGWETINRLVRPDILAGLIEMFHADRLARAAGQKAATIPVAHPDPLVPASLPSADAWAFFEEWMPKVKGKWENKVTVRTLEACRAYDPSLFIARISPTPLLMVVAEKDCVTPTDLALSAFARANEPKQLEILRGCTHFEAYKEPFFSEVTAKEIEFLRKTLL